MPKCSQGRLDFDGKEPRKSYDGLKEGTDGVARGAATITDPTAVPPNGQMNGRALTTTIVRTAAPGTCRRTRAMT